MDFPVTNNFMFSEMTATQCGIPNTISSHEQVVNITKIAVILQVFRDYLNIIPDFYNLGHEVSIVVNSCYRNKAVNKAVGGQPNSFHLKGLAVDFKLGHDFPSRTLEKMFFEFASYQDNLFKRLGIEPGYHYRINKQSIHVQFHPYITD